MSATNDEAYRQRIAQLEAENARLREILDEVKADRRQLAERVYGPVPDKYRPTEEELLELMRNHGPVPEERELITPHFRAIFVSSPHKTTERG
jgi:predicted nuclease with TOPRIM domain